MHHELKRQSEMSIFVQYSSYTCITNVCAVSRGANNKVIATKIKLHTALDRMQKKNKKKNVIVNLATSKTQS